MRNLRSILSIIAVAASILACSLVGMPASAPVDNVATIVVSTIQALTAAAPIATVQPATQAPQGIPVNYKDVTFTIPSGLATNANPLTIPAMTEDNGGPWGAAPEHLEFRLDNYNVPTGSFTVCHIEVYPAQGYSAANTGANISLQRLQGLLSNPSAPLTNRTLPQVPSFNAASMFAAQVQRISFQNGRGVRMITQYGQAVAPATNNMVFYHFQGLTDDGKHYIVAVLPINSVFLQAGDKELEPLPAGGVPFPGYNLTDAKPFDEYYKAVTDKLNAASPDQFSPSLAVLDALIQSLSVNP